VDQWLASACGSGVTIAPLDIVAAGAARLCATAGRQDGLEPDAALCTSCGMLSPGGSGACRSCGQPAVPLLEHLAPGRAGSPEPAATLTLVGTGAGGLALARPIEGAFFRLGRNPASDWRFSDDAYPSVSAAHAVIRREGDD